MFLKNILKNKDELSQSLSINLPDLLRESKIIKCAFLRASNNSSNSILAIEMRRSLNCQRSKIL